MNLIAAFGYVIGVLLFAYFIRKKRQSLMQTKTDKMMSHRKKKEEDQPHD